MHENVKYSRGFTASKQLDFAKESGNVKLQNFLKCMKENKNENTVAEIQAVRNCTMGIEKK
jgi:hypothetical protein